MGLKETLQDNNVPLPPDFDERMDVVVSALRGDASKLEAFKKQKGGADEIPIPVKPNKNDFLGPRLRWVVEALGSPYAQPVIRMVFIVLFFISYLESIPLFGSILSAVLDLMLMGSKMLVKSVQKILPPLIAIIPLPYMNFAGMGLAAVFGMLIWPIVAIVSFSRQDFTAAIEAMMRVIPPPMGDTIADLFLEANRAVARIDEKRQKLVSDITNGIKNISSIFSNVTGQAKEGAEKLIAKTREAGLASKVSSGLSRARELGSSSLSRARQLVQGGRMRFSRRQRRHNKWRKTRRLYGKH